MSRREKEFNNRTAIFEGAYRAWSHLGGLTPEILEARTMEELEPSTFILTDDPRLSQTPPSIQFRSDSPDGSARREIAHEVLPKSGLLHPFVKSILAHWLAPPTDRETLEFGLATLRTWWQHRRKGENKTFLKALQGNEKLQLLLSDYTRSFFFIAYSLVMGDSLEGPRTLNKRMQGHKKSLRTPVSLERVSSARSRIVTSSFALTSTMSGKLSGNITLPDAMCAPYHKGSLLSDRNDSMYAANNLDKANDNKLPFVYCSANGDCLIQLQIEGVSCNHCVKFIETVLRGCACKSSIAGLIDAVADRELGIALIKIDSPNNAKRIASEALRNLNILGYMARPKEMDWNDESIDLSLFTVPSHHGDHTYSFFDWSRPCTCSENGAFPKDCDRHMQMSTSLIQALSDREDQIADVLALSSLGLEQLREDDHYEEDHEPIPIVNRRSLESLPYSGILTAASLPEKSASHPRSLRYVDPFHEFNYCEHSADETMASYFRATI